MNLLYYSWQFKIKGLKRLTFGTDLHATFCLLWWLEKVFNLHLFPFKMFLNSYLSIFSSSPSILCRELITCSPSDWQDWNDYYVEMLCIGWVMRRLLCWQMEQGWDDNTVKRVLLFRPWVNCDLSISLLCHSRPTNFSSLTYTFPLTCSFILSELLFAASVAVPIVLFRTLCSVWRLCLVHRFLFCFAVFLVSSLGGIACSWWHTVLTGIFLQCIVGFLCMLMKANVKMCAPFHILCVDDIVFLTIISSTLWDQYLKKFSLLWKQAFLALRSVLVDCSFHTGVFWHYKDFFLWSGHESFEC